MAYCLYFPQEKFHMLRGKANIKTNSNFPEKKLNSEYVTKVNAGEARSIYYNAVEPLRYSKSKA